MHLLVADAGLPVPLTDHLKHADTVAHLGTQGRFPCPEAVAALRRNAVIVWEHLVPERGSRHINIRVTLEITYVSF